VANKMADKKKPTSQSQTAEPKARESAKEQAQGKNAREATRDRDGRKEKESKAVARGRVSNQREEKAPSAIMVRLRSYRAVRFLLESYYELRHKVTWPTFREARNMTIVVILLSAAVGLILGLADLGLGQLYLLITHLAGIK
jgi:preprotein translocase SecE subunit